MFIGIVLIVLAVAAVSTLLVYRSFWLPLRRLVSGAERIARGDLEARIDVETPTELGRLAAVLNRIAENLRQAERQRIERSPDREQQDLERTPELTTVQRQMIHAEKMASLGRLAGAVAHEINNPLSAMLMYARLVERELGDGGFAPEKRDELGRYLKQVQQDARRCGEIVNNMLLFARPSGGEFAVHHMNQIVARSLMLVGHNLEMAHIEIESHPCEGDDAIACEADYLQQVLVTLLVNAAEAMPGGGRLSVRTAATDGSVHVEISSVARSVPAKTPPCVVGPSVSARANDRAAALGLAGVDLIIQRHGGTIEVDASAGNGRTVRLLLPRSPLRAGPATM